MGTKLPDSFCEQNEFAIKDFISSNNNDHNPKKNVKIITDTEPNPIFEKNVTVTAMKHDNYSSYDGYNYYVDIEWDEVKQNNIKLGLAIHHDSSKYYFDFSEGKLSIRYPNNYENPDISDYKIEITLY